MTRLDHFSIGVLALALAGGGCATAMNKVSQRNVPMPAAEAVNHTKDVMNDYGFDIQVIDPHDGATRLKGDHVDGQKVTADITPVKEGTSHIKIRVTGRQPRTSAKTILDDIAVRYE